MNSISSVMNLDPIFCASDTRIAEVKHLLKKYNCEEIVVVDTAEKRHPIGVISLEDVSASFVEDSAIPSDVSAIECMRAIPAVVHEDSSLDECLNVMRANFMERIPVVDLEGHIAGMLEKSVIVKELI